MIKRKPLLSKLRVEVGTFVSTRIKFDIKKHIHKIYSVIKIRWFRSVILNYAKITVGSI